MAQDPKSGDQAEAPVTSRKRFIIMIVTVLALISGGAVWYYMQQQHAPGKKEAELAKLKEAAKTPVFVTMDTFTVNLQDKPEERLLQLDLSLQVANPEVAELLKVQMPAVRNRLLMLLTNKKATEISTTEGKKQLSSQIAAEVRKPFITGTKPQKVLGVFFTSFVIQ